MRRTPLLLGIVLILGGCSGGAASDTTGEDSILNPTATVESFFSLLGQSEYAGTATLVDERQLAVLTAIEGASGAEVASMLTAGVPDQVRADFWEAFATSLPALLEQTAGQAQVGDQEDLGDGFRALEVAFPGTPDAATWIVRDVDGSWLIDLFATFGPVFGPNLASWYGTLDPGADRDVIREVVVAGRPSLEMGLEHEPLGPLGDDAVKGVLELLAEVGT